MQILLGGVRGTSPVTHRDCMKYGGATTCVLIGDRAGTRIILDAGTGLQNLQPCLMRQTNDLPDLMLFTHYHLDHLIGLPSFASLYDPNARVQFASPVREGVTTEDAIRRLMDKPFWPVKFSAHCEYLVLSESSGEAPWRHGAFDVRWCTVHHRNGCHAYRIDSREDCASVVFATDLEWQASAGAERDALFQLCQMPTPVDLLIMDGQFDAADGSRFSGWGHSTWQDAVEVAESVGAGQLVVTHHAPASSDEVLDLRVEKLRSAFTRARLAYDGLDIRIGR